jgi:NADPH-dependent 2,4-dienoyl-CoA reductase/sulfur reductase-like enzyme/rhodanese-related sulfurtransferase
MKVVIIGGVAGGASTATRLRRLDENAEIIIIERGEFVSFANCGLPFYIGNDIKNKEDLIVQTPERFKQRFNIDVRVYNEALSINTKFKSVTIKNLKNEVIYTESYDKLVLSPGAMPIKPNIEGIENENVFTIRNIPDTYKIKEYITNNKPKGAVIVGGGYIGIEMAENLSDLDINVTIVELNNHLIGPLDIDMASFVKNYLVGKGIKVKLSNGVKKIEKVSNRLKVILDKGDIETDMVIMSVGVKPESTLALDANLDVNGRGSIVVNDRMQTSDENIYAIGDAAEITNFVTKEKGFIPLAGPASKQARVVANNICNINSTYKGTQGSSIIKVFDMTVAATGINETTAKLLKIDYDKVVIHQSSHATYYPNALPIVIKVIYEKNTGKILGAQLIGYDGVDKRCDVIATAIRGSMTASDLAELELCYAPPYSSAKDPVNIAGYVIENAILDKVRNVHFEFVQENLDNPNVIFLDVRTKNECEKLGSIKNSINIPVDELRERIDEIDKSKKIIIICHSGMRSYLAYRMLTSKGYDCYNLTGGYSLYSSMLKAMN